jgi:hypothetical protein
MPDLALSDLDRLLHLVEHTDHWMQHNDMLALISIVRDRGRDNLEQCHHFMDIATICGKPAVKWHVSEDTKWIHPRCQKHVMKRWMGDTLDKNQLDVLLIHES